MLGEVRTAEAHVSENRENVYSDLTVLVTKIFKTANSSIIEGIVVIQSTTPESLHEGDWELAPLTLRSCKAYCSRVPPNPQPFMLTHNQGEQYVETSHTKTHNPIRARLHFGGRVVHLCFVDESTAVLLLRHSNC